MIYKPRKAAGPSASRAAGPLVSRTATSRTNPGTLSAAKPVSSVHGRPTLPSDTCTWPQQLRFVRRCHATVPCLDRTAVSACLKLSCMSAFWMLRSAVLAHLPLCRVRTSRCRTTARAGRTFRAVKPSRSSAATNMITGCGEVVKSCIGCSTLHASPPADRHRYVSNHSTGKGNVK